MTSSFFAAAVTFNNYVELAANSTVTLVATGWLVESAPPETLDTQFPPFFRTGVILAIPKVW